MHPQRTPTRPQGALPYPPAEVLRAITPERYRPVVLQEPQQHTLSKSAFEAQLDKERRKIKALEASLLTTTTELRNLQLEATRLRVEADHSTELIGENKKKTDEVMFYQDSLELIKKEVETLNKALQSKNREHMELMDEAEALRKETRLLAEDKQELAAMLARGLDMLLDLCHGLAIDFLPGKDTDSSEQLRAICDALNKSFHQLCDERDLLIQVNEDVRREYSERYMKERERSIRLEYQVKLLEDRKYDQDKQLDYRQTEEKDRRIQLLELKLLQMEQESERKLQELSMQKLNQEDRLFEQSQEKENTLMEQTGLLSKRVRELEREKRELRAELDKVRERYKGLNDKYARINFEAVHNKNSNEYLVFMKQLRTYEEDKKATEIVIEQLTFQNRVLEQELALYRHSTN